MKSERPREVTGHSRHFLRNYLDHPERREITDYHTQYVLDHAAEGFFGLQDDGLWQFTGVYVPDLGYVLRVVVHPDGKVYTAYNDKGETSKHFERR
ncbi:MAG: hypothetical protein ACRDSJ_23920 [Rubrobacteraceae bacterium]